jgi:low affinity Fe/Cu permease
MRMTQRRARVRDDDEQPRRSYAFERMATRVTRFTGSGPGFALALGTIVVWGISGPIFGWSDTWQLVINTGTTIVTFLMVFLIQRTQNKDGMAIQLKLNELVAAMDGASNRLISIEDLSERELRVLHEHFQRLAAMARAEGDVLASHSVDEAEARHESKREHQTGKKRAHGARNKA